MSGAETGTDRPYGTIVIVGGGCYGSYYVRQLQRAARAGAVVARELLVVDHNASCAVAASQASAESANVLPTRIVVRDWRAFFQEYLTCAADDPLGSNADAIVPSPLMPHLMAEWLVHRARDRWPNRSVRTERLERPPAVPWERAGADGTHYVSFATWTCPINCIEPRICPETRDVRDWSLPVRLAEHAHLEHDTGHDIDVAVLHCRHRTYGVGMFDTAEVVAADSLIASAGARESAEVIIGTVSHCHGALTRLLIGEVSSQSSSQVC
jgi:hypothetical protein